MQSRNSTPRIMAVDDTEDILLIIKMGLEVENFKVDIFNSAKSAIEAFERHAPDYDYYKLVLTDIRESPTTPTTQSGQDMGDNLKLPS
jgi:CheY-like chemotaxis protein